jgi:hypothetical protein
MTGRRPAQSNLVIRRAMDSQSSVRCAASGNAGSPCSPAAGAPWRHITASPSKIGDIARTALVLTHFEHGCIT